MNEDKTVNTFCAVCGVRGCKSMGELPSSCPGRLDITSQAAAEYADPEIRKLAEASGRTSLSPGLTRIEETMDFCRRCGFTEIGLAFCSLLYREAQMVTEIFTNGGFNVHSVICKVGSISKDTVGIEGHPSAMCNPIAQAELMNAQHTDINVILGLCVGHDSLFIKYSQAPVTVLAVKDKVLGHNPLGVLAVMETNYYKEKFKK